MKAGNYLIKWCHCDSEKKELATKETICVIQDENLPFTIGRGVALCSLKDQFTKDKGRKVSLLRAMQNAGIKKENRIPIWEIYRTSMTLNPRWKTEKK
jgi:hypothetical protein